MFRLARRSPLLWLAGLAWLIAACGVAPAPRVSASKAAALRGGTVTFAELPGNGPISIFPLYNGAQWFFANEQWFTYLSWPPLYVWGKGTQPTFNPTLSLAYPPTFSKTSTGHTVATITLKHWMWSDGVRLTTRDIQFWMNLLNANKVDWAPYVPGYFPDNVSNVKYLSSSSFRITFNARYSTRWLLGNELPQIFPIPQHAWDKTSASGPIGNYDLTPAGARSVYRFLESQNRDPAAYATNPLWKVVDGAWKISAYSPATDYTSFIPNRRFSGTPKPHVTKFVELPFTNDTSEFDALQAGQIDFGYVPLNDISTIPSLKHRGYQIAPWPQYTWGGILFNFAKNDPATPILSQLYVRQAMTHLVPMTAILNKLEHGYGYYASGPIANPGGNNPLVTSYARTDPYPYSVRAAVNLFKAHGWRVIPNGVTTCVRPGVAGADCGKGVARGAQLTFRYLTDTETQLDAGINQVLKSTFSLAGIQLDFHVLNGPTESAAEASCTGHKTCSWDLNYQIEYWSDGNPDWWPTGGEPFGCGGIGNEENWCTSESQHLIGLTHSSSSLSALYAYENYIVKEQPIIFLPMPVLRIAAIKKPLKGVLPLNSLHTIYPNDFYYAK